MNTIPSTNPDLDLAFNYVAHTNRNVFLTGKAGTGKTTFLHRVRREVPKEIAVVAPTGVAAINAKAQTIHSLFSLPLGFIPPGRPVPRKRNLSGKKVATLRAIDLLIIDEISMVRADVLDAIDATLRNVRNNTKPFGGVQLLMIGDLHQLPPVVVREEERMVREHYATPYYFAARALAGANMASVSLTHIYRQKDAEFIDLLNKVRNNEMSDGVVAALNTRFRPDFSVDSDAGYITLASHNATARAINTKQLARQAGRRYDFSAKITGKFPRSMYPNDPLLHFKVGAQVMFNRNDSQYGLYYNGKIGCITAINEDRITVVCERNEAPIEVKPIVWENVKYDAKAGVGLLEEEAVGKYEQHPLRLAYAITIHKSQGLTFDKVVLDAGGSFTHGQVYVALSRCKTFEGIVLRSKISRRSVRTDGVVSDHSRAAEDNQPSTTDLAEDRRKYQLSCLEQLFDFQEVQLRADEIARVLSDPSTVITGNGVRNFMNLRERLRRAFVSTSRAFLPTLRRYDGEGRAPETDEAILGRLKSAAKYYAGCFAGESGNALRDYAYLTDNTTVRGKLDDALRQLRLSYYIKQRCFEQLAEGFTTIDYANTRRRAHRDFNRLADPAKRTAGATAGGAKLESPHPDLYEELCDWRYRLARELQTDAYKIIHNSVLLAITSVLPVTDRALLKIKKVGPKTLERYGMDILRMVKTYALKHGEVTNVVGQDQQPHLVATADSGTLQLFQSGASVSEVARRRGVSERVLYAKAAAWVRQGVLNPTDVLSPERFAAVEKFTDGATLRDIGVLAVRGEGLFSVGELRLVLVGRGVAGLALAG